VRATAIMRTLESVDDGRPAFATASGVTEVIDAGWRQLLADAGEAVGVPDEDRAAVTGVADELFELLEHYLVLGRWDGLAAAQQMYGPLSAGEKPEPDRASVNAWADVLNAAWLARLSAPQPPHVIDKIDQLARDALTGLGAGVAA
jgi:hypothetical protein